MKTTLIFKNFTAFFETKKEADIFLKDLDKLCDKHDSTGDNISFDYEVEN